MRNFEIKPPVASECTKFFGILILYSKFQKNFPTRTMLEGGTKVIVTTDLSHPMLCKEGSLRLAKAVHKEKSTEVKTADSKNGEPKKSKKKSSKSRKQMIQSFQLKS